MKVIIQYFNKGEFGEQIFSNPTLHTTGEEALYNLIRKAVSKKVDGTCFVYLIDRERKQEYYKVWRDLGKVTMQRCVRPTGTSEVTGRPKHTTMKQCVVEIYNVYQQILEDEREEVKE